MTLSRYRVTIDAKEYRGTMTVVAFGIEQAKQKACEAEGCPSRCITKVEHIETIYHTQTT